MQLGVSLEVRIDMDLMREYMLLQQTIDEAKLRQEEVKETLWEELEAGQAAPGKKWEYDEVGSVCLVKGRAGKKTLNRAKLVQQGVTAEQLKAATDTGKDGVPHLRIERPKG